MPPRGSNAARKQKKRRPTGDPALDFFDEAPPPPRPKPTTLMGWWAEHWHGWIKSIALVTLLIVGYIAYKNGALPEIPAGVLLIGLVVIAAIATGAIPAFEALLTPFKRYALIAYLVVWGVFAAWAPLRVAVPGQPLAEARVATGKAALTTNVKLPDGGSGPFTIAVTAALKGMGDIEANYNLTVTGADSTSQQVTGTIRHTHPNEFTTAVATSPESIRDEDTETTHRLDQVKGHDLTVTASGWDESMPGGLLLRFFKAGPPLGFYVLGSALFLLIGLVLDYRFLQPKHPRTYFATIAGFLLVFSLYFPTEASEHFLVRPAVAAVAIATGGALGGWLIGLVVNLFKPEPKKLIGEK